MKFVALGVAAKVVVIINNEDACLRIFLSIKVRSRKTTDSTADDNEIVNRGVRFLNFTPVMAALPGELMGDFKGALMVTPHTCECGRVHGIIWGSAQLFGE